VDEAKKPNWVDFSSLTITRNHAPRIKYGSMGNMFPDCIFNCLILGRKTTGLQVIILKITGNFA